MTDETCSIVYLFNTHLDHHSTQAQIEGVTVIMDQMRQILHGHNEMETACVLVTGDMNVDSNDQALRAFSDAETYGFLPSSLLSGTFTGWKDRSNGATIDHIFIRTQGGSSSHPRSLVEAVKYRVESNVDSKGGQGGPLVSDHRPVIVDFRIC